MVEPRSPSCSPPKEMPVENQSDIIEDKEEREEDEKNV
jgi:hypothetical protein